MSLLLFSPGGVPALGTVTLELIIKFILQFGLYRLLCDCLGQPLSFTELVKEPTFGDEETA